MTNSKAFVPKSWFYTLSIIHTGLTFGVLLFTLIVVLSGKDLILGFTANKSFFVYIVPLAAMISYFGSNYYYNKQLINITESKSFKSRLLRYQQAWIIQLAFLEAATLLSSVCLMLDNNVFYLVISLLLILYLFKVRPTKKKLISDLNLNLEEQQYFQSENEEPK